MRRFLYFLAVLSVCFISTEMWGQTPINKPPRWNNNGQTLKGDFVQIGNIRKNLRQSGMPTFPMEDAGAGVGNKPTQSCSAATIKIPSASSCLRVKWAGLYWVSALDNNNSAANASKIRTVKFKVPGENAFRTLTADVEMHQVFSGHEYVYNCFKDVTSIVQGVGVIMENTL